MDEFLKYITVYLIGAAGIWKGIPAGIALGLPSILTASFTTLGAISSSLLIYFSGEPFRRWLLSKYGEKSIAKKREKFSIWLEKYGVVGLGLIVTGLLGPIVALLIGMLLLSNTQKFIAFLILGIIIWSFGITYLSEPIIEMVKYLL